MIINEELAASLDEPTKTVVMHRTEPTRVQSQALQLADKINVLLDYNERLWELKMTPLGQYSTGGRYDRNFQNRQGNRQGRQGRQGFQGKKDGGGRRHNRRQQNSNQQHNQQQQQQQPQENKAAAE